MTPRDEVSQRTSQALREAMTRLLAGNPEHTDGRLTKANLGREAGISHATLHRATALLAEWDAAVGKRTPEQARHQNDMSVVRADLKKKTGECADLRKRLNAAATVIATLHHENTALRAQLTRQGTVVAIGHQRSAEVDT